ncbi:hypothetical protein [Agrobacterium pusense]|uniref:hypothetical protein n=1 Tax=Agrobacterium pusense TaxID=648995 RepID=UPI001AE85C6F|nr:hypothetical protein [Agrobacterium pusense]MBP2611490.1 hypothetical protein [Agrobacterium pusense]
MNAVSNPSTKAPVTPITGIPYIEAMQHCASIGSLSSLREMLKEVEDRGAFSEDFSALAAYCKRASDFEEHFGAGSLLDLSHPSVVILIENVISPKELLAIRGRQKAIAMNPIDVARAEALASEGRLII